jgi:hypothetical protein
MCSNIYFLYFRIVYQAIKRRISPLKFVKNYQIDHHIHVRTSSNVGMSISATSLLCAQCMLLCAIFQLFDSKRSLIRYVLLMFCTFDLLHFDWITYFESSNTHHCIFDVLHFDWITYFGRIWHLHFCFTFFL